jgi:hypothetical protein
LSSSSSSSWPGHSHSHCTNFFLVFLAYHPTPDTRPPSSARLILLRLHAPDGKIKQRVHPTPPTPTPASIHNSNHPHRRRRMVD